MGLVTVEQVNGSIKFEDYIIHNLLEYGNVSLPLAYAKYSLKQISEELTAICGFPVVCEQTENGWENDFGCSRVTKDIFLIARKTKS